MGRGDREEFDPETSELPGGPIAEHELWLSKIGQDGQEAGVVDSTGRYHKFSDGEQFLQIGGGNERIPFIRTKEGINVPFEEWAQPSPESEQLAEPTTSEVLLETDQKSDQVFGRIYEKLSGLAKLKTTRKELVTIGDKVAAKEVPTDPSADFVRGYFESADRSTTGLAGRTGRQIMEGYQTALAANPSHGTVERGRRVLEDESTRITELVRAGEVDALTAQIFANALRLMKRGLSLAYNDLTHRETVTHKDEAEQTEYKAAITQLFAGKWGRIHEQPDGPFIHVNSATVTDSQEETAERFYISGNPNKNSAELVKVWAQTLDELGLGEDIYYKLPTFDATNRYEQLVVYKPSGPNGSKTDEAIKRFSERCDPSLLSDEPMPTGGEMAKGIFTAPEPAHLNNILRYATRDGDNFDQLSYNQLAATNFELAMRRAVMEITAAGGTIDTTRPRDLREKAVGYFAKFMTLSGIDPATMKGV